MTWLLEASSAANFPRAYSITGANAYRHLYRHEGSPNLNDVQSLALAVGFAAAGDVDLDHNLERASPHQR